VEYQEPSSHKFTCHPQRQSSCALALGIISKASSTSTSSRKFCQKAILEEFPSFNTNYPEILQSASSPPSTNQSLIIMDISHPSRFLDPSSAMETISKQKSEAIRLAKEQAVAVKEMCRRAKTDLPPYEFEELIGKGAYGRVYKGLSDCESHSCLVYLHLS
jgi:hypothetical protein